MVDKILQIDVIENLFLNNIKTNILLLKVAKEAGYNKTNITFIGIDPENSPYKEPEDIDQLILKQEDYLAFILLGGLNQKQN